MGVRLLTRTTRTVTRTEAGDGLLNEIGPLLDEIDDHLHGLGGEPDGVDADKFARSCQPPYSFEWSIKTLQTS
ncbi:hypothetical protein AL050_26795 [Pseudomonas syringae pv. daphniphylli]|nr:hypothetical protein AL050_26795 [Pseudomonas syringae pv. daphniphylli]